MTLGRTGRVRIDRETDAVKELKLTHLKGRMTTQREKMLAGELYDPLDPELVTARVRARDLCQDLNATRESQEPERRRRPIRPSRFPPACRTREFCAAPDRTDAEG